MSTHLIDEAAGLLERVVVIDKDRVALEGEADELRGSVTSVSGPALAVEEFTAGRPVWGSQRLGSRQRVILVATFGDADRARARTLRLELEPLSLQQVVVQAATPAGSRERTSA